MNNSLFTNKDKKFIPFVVQQNYNPIELYKKGYKIRIKKQNKGKFTDYCGGSVTDECIQRGKNSPDPKIRKRATFADNARHFKHRFGGQIVQEVKLRKMLNN